jgi:ureidoglycolate dehydrogenase (NAD+)
MRWCIEHAHNNGGIACAGVRHAGHCVASSPYVALAADAGLIGFACTNSAPMVAPPGGRTPTLSTNPLAFGIPARRHPPILLDMATTTVAAVKVLQASMLGTPVPVGWVADAAGLPTTDPARVIDRQDGRTRFRGLMLPLGSPSVGYKGFGLAMIVDLLAGVLTGGAFARHVNQFRGDVGHFFWAMDPTAYGSLDVFLDRVDEQIDQIKSSDPLDGADEIVIPGERGYLRRKAMLASGSVAIGDATWGVLTQTCAMMQVPLPHIERLPVGAGATR